MHYINPKIHFSLFRLKNLESLLYLGKIYCKRGKELFKGNLYPFVLSRIAERSLKMLIHIEIREPPLYTFMFRLVVEVPLVVPNLDLLD